MKSTKIVLEGKEVEIQAVPLRKLLEVFKFVKSLPDKVRQSLADVEVSELKGLDNATAISVFSNMLVELGDEILELIALVSGLPLKKVENLSISDSMKLVRAVVEVNDIEEIKKEFGELTNMFKAEEPQETEAKQVASGSST